MTVGLLISVRDLAEARIAVEGGADIVDLKEPNGGSLGPCSTEIWRDVATNFAGSVPLSAALGELRELRDGVSCKPAISSRFGFHFVKMGLAGMVDQPQWREDWQAIQQQVSGPSQFVAVAYADFADSQSPAPEAIIEQGGRTNCGAFLLDTFGKRKGDLFDHVPSKTVLHWLRLARDAGMRTVIGGSLNEKSLPEAYSLTPDFLAVRGAVCRGSRTGCVDSKLVARWRQSMDMLADRSAA